MNDSWWGEKKLPVTVRLCVGGEGCVNFTPSQLLTDLNKPSHVCVCVPSSLWTTTGRVCTCLIGRWPPEFWPDASEPRCLDSDRTPSPTNDKHKHYSENMKPCCKHETRLMKPEKVLSWRHSPQCSSARPPGILYTPGWVCRTQWPQQEDSPSLLPPGLRTRRTTQLHFTFTSLNVCVYILQQLWPLHLLLYLVFGCFLVRLNFFDSEYNRETLQITWRRVTELFGPTRSFSCCIDGDQAHFSSLHFSDFGLVSVVWWF